MKNLELQDLSKFTTLSLCYQEFINKCPGCKIAKECVLGVTGFYSYSSKDCKVRVIVTKNYLSVYLFQKRRKHVWNTYCSCPAFDFDLNRKYPEELSKHAEFSHKKSKDHQKKIQQWYPMAWRWIKAVLKKHYERKSINEILEGLS